MKERWLEIPSLSQGNRSTTSDEKWCGRAAASMVYNYYMRVQGKDDELIVNDQEEADLLYPDGTIAARGFDLEEPLKKAHPGWRLKSLFPQAGRTLPVSDAQVETLLGPVIDSININNPLVAYTGISLNKAKPRHIVVIAGYRYDAENALWLLFDDPATMRDTNARYEKSDFLNTENLEILDAGRWEVHGATYWIKAKRLFEHNQRSDAPDDLWCDHRDRPGFAVWINADPTPESTLVHQTFGAYFPVDLGDGRAVTDKTLDAFYAHTEKTYAGGYYPVGANTVWHGGVHVHVPPETEVHACLPGRIIAARLAESPPYAEGHYGSRNFILLEHTREEKKFYSLYMHLAAVPLEADDPFLQRLKWVGRGVPKLRFKQLRNYRGQPSSRNNEPLGQFQPGDEVEFIASASSRPWKKVRTEDGAEVFVSAPPSVAEEVTVTVPDADLMDRFRGGEVVQLDVEVAGDQLLWLSGDFGSRNYRTGLIHWEIFSSENLFPPNEDDGGASGNGAPASPAAESSTPDGGETSNEGPTAERAVLVREVRGPEQVFVGSEATFRATSFNVIDPTAAERRQVNWVVRVDEEEVLRREGHGDVLQVPVEDAWRGKTLKVFPFRNRPSDKVCVKAEVSTRDRLVWKAVEDANEDFNLDARAIVELFEASQEDGLLDSELLTADELKQFYGSNPNAVRLRTYACRFVSEWGIPDLDAAISAMRGRYVTWNLKARMQPYQWWQEARDAGVDLPESSLIWHYNPITVLEAAFIGGSMPMQVAGLPAAVSSDLYGCHDLQRGDVDPVPNAAHSPRWGGVANAPDSVGGCTATPNPRHVRQLQEDLRMLGFLIVGTPDGDFGRRTEWAVREFQIYARMAQVARVRADAPAATQQAAHLAGQEGQEGDLSAYVASLEPVANDARYTGPVSGVVNADTRTAIRHWLDHNWRCPVIIEGWRMQGGNRHSVFQHNGIWAVNLWKHDDVPSATPRMFVRDFSDYYTLPAGYDADAMHVVGYFEPSHIGGPRSVPPNHTWAEGEILPESLVGVQNLNAAQESTFKIIRAVSEVECIGFFDSVNSYDNAFVSVGPCHWTLGIISANGVFSEGELCGYLAYLRHADPAAFQQAFEAFGMRVDEDWMSAAGQANGAALYRAGSRKYAGWVALQGEDGSFTRLAETEDDGDYFKTWHWFYRFVMAGRTVAGYRRRMWDMARIRLRDIRNTPWGPGVTNVADGSANGRPPTIGDVFTSERALAIILRWHIRYPAHMINGGNAGTRIRNAFGHASATAVAGGWNGDPSTWTDDHEEALVEGLRTEAQALGNQDLQDSINHVDNWPAWHGGANPRGYALADPVTPLSEDRGSLTFDATGLPPAPP